VHRQINQISWGILSIYQITFVRSVVLIEANFSSNIKKGCTFDVNVAFISREMSGMAKVKHRNYIPDRTINHGVKVVTAMPPQLSGNKQHFAYGSRK
jgi:hypothetical protein